MSKSLIYILKMAGFNDVKIIDIDATAGTRGGLKKCMRKVLLGFYKMRFQFYNRITNSAFHTPSPQCFSYEVKALARC